MHEVKPKTVVVLGTGGTIAGLADAGAARGYRAAQVAIEELAAGLGLAAGCRVISEQVAQMDSKDMSDDVWLALLGRVDHWVRRADVDGVVIAHGTDTLEETAFFLHALVDSDKPVVLTGAMRPASDAQADGPGNLRDAVRVAMHDQARGAIVVFAGKILAARGVRKVHPTRLDAFASVDGLAIGWLDAVEIHTTGPWPQSGDDAFVGGLAALQEAMAGADALPWVAWLTSHAGATGQEVRALVDAGVKGLLVAGTGNATVHEKLAHALDEARTRGVAVVVTSRCADPFAASGTADGLPPAQARVALQLRLLQKNGGA